MADETDTTPTEPTDEPTSTEPTNEAGETRQEEATDSAEQWKSHSRKWEKLAKSNAEKARLWDAAQAEKADKNDSDDDTAQELARITAELHAAEAALEHGLSKDQLAVLGDPMADDYPDRAKALAALMKTSASTGRRAPALGSERAPGGGSGDFLRDALTRGS